MIMDRPNRSRALRLRGWPWRSVAVLVVGIVLYVAVLLVLLDTEDPVYIPVLLLLGAGIVPLTLTTLVTEVEAVRRLSATQVAACAVLAGVVGGVLAGQLEVDTVRQLGTLPWLLVGLIEESAKLAVPVALFAWRRPGLRAVDGLVLGVAAGSGFAAMETMGYSFVALLRSGGQLPLVDDLLLNRALGSLGGHAAWTGLACAAFFAIRASRHRWVGVLRFLVTFGAVVALHAQWDASSAAGNGYATVAGAGLVLLGVTTWCLRRRRSPEDTLPSGRTRGEGTPEGPRRDLVPVGQVAGATPRLVPGDR